MKIFSERLKELREKEYTQDAIAKKLNITQQSYQRYENGTGEPSLQTLAEISKIFDVSADYLLGIKDTLN